MPVTSDSVRRWSCLSRRSRDRTVVWSFVRRSHESWVVAPNGGKCRDFWAGPPCHRVRPGRCQQSSHSNPTSNLTVMMSPDPRSRSGMDAYLAAIALFPVLTAVRDESISPLVGDWRCQRPPQVNTRIEE
jgi:hypothetical protein